MELFIFKYQTTLKLCGKIKMCSDKFWFEAEIIKTEQGYTLKLVNKFENGRDRKKRKKQELLSHCMKANDCNADRRKLYE